MKKIAVMLILSLMFVSVMQRMSFAIDGGTVGGVATTEELRLLPDGTYRKYTETVVKPSKSGAIAGVGAGAVVGSVAGPVGAAVGAVVGGIAGWIWGPAD